MMRHRGLLEHPRLPGALGLWVKGRFVIAAVQITHLNAPIDFRPKTLCVCASTLSLWGSHQFFASDPAFATIGGADAPPVIAVGGNRSFEESQLRARRQAIVDL